MFKNKNLEKIITHKYTLYFMYFLALLNGVNYFKKQKIYCALIAIAFFLLSNKFLTKNKALSIFYSLFLANFVLGCGKIIEGMGKDCGDCIGLRGWDADNLTIPSEFMDCVAKVRECQEGKKLSSSEVENVRKIKFFTTTDDKTLKALKSRTIYKDGSDGKPDEDTIGDAIWKLYKKDQEKALEQSNTQQNPRQASRQQQPRQASPQQQPRQASRQQQPRQASPQQQPRQAPGQQQQQPTTQPQPRQPQPRQVPQAQSTHTHNKQVVLITASAVASALALIVATGAIFLVNKKKF